MMITHPNSPMDIFLWRLHLLWTLVLTLSCVWFTICNHPVVRFQIPTHTMWKSLQCGLFLQKFWIRTILVNGSPLGSIWMAEKRKPS